MSGTAWVFDKELMAQWKITIETLRFWVQVTLPKKKSTGWEYSLWVSPNECFSTSHLCIGLLAAKTISSLNGYPNRRPNRVWAYYPTLSPRLLGEQAQKSLGIGSPGFSITLFERIFKASVQIIEITLRGIWMASSINMTLKNNNKIRLFHISPGCDIRYELG